MRAERWGFARCVVPAPDLARARVAVDPRRRARRSARRTWRRPTASSPAASTSSRSRTSSSATPPRWNRDPKTGIEAPLDFGKQLDYRDARRVGDIKYLWEPNRHLHLVTLAQAYALTRRRRATRDALRAHLESWFEACPFRMGAELVRARSRRRCGSSTGRSRGSSSAASTRRCSRATRARASARAGSTSVYQHARVRRRPLLAALVGQQPPDRRGDGPLSSPALTWPHWPRADAVARARRARSSSARRCCRTRPTA